MTLAPLLSIPSPSDPLIAELGPLKLRWYGTLIAIGILLAGWIAERELTRRGYPPGRTYTIAIWAVPAGVIGARLYHVATDWDRFSGHLERRSRSLAGRARDARRDRGRRDRRGDRRPEAKASRCSSCST